MNSDQEGGSVFLFWSSWIAAIFRNTLLKLVQKNRKRKKILSLFRLVLSQSETSQN